MLKSSVSMGLILIVYSVPVEIPQYDPWRNYWYTETVYVYPYQIIGAIVLLIGFVTAVIGYAMPEKKLMLEKKYAPKEKVVRLERWMEPIESESVEEITCGTCLYFRTSKCPINETEEAIPCKHYYHKG